jgi:hypothetical protein
MLQSVDLIVTGVRGLVTFDYPSDDGIAVEVRGFVTDANPTQRTHGDLISISVMQSKLNCSARDSSYK